MAFLLMLAIFFVGCAHELKFTSFGEMKPAFDRQVVEGYGEIEKDKAPGPSLEEVKVYMKTFPPGMAMEGGTVSVAPDSTRVVIGMFEWRGSGLLPSDDMASAELAKIAKTAGGNELVILDVFIDRGYLHSAKSIVILNKAAPGPTNPEAGQSI